MKDWLEFLRGIVRPATALMLVIAAIAYVGIGLLAPDRLWDLTLVVVGYYFGSRAKTETPPT